MILDWYARTAGTSAAEFAPHDGWSAAHLTVLCDASERRLSVDCAARLRTSPYGRVGGGFNRSTCSAQTFDHEFDLRAPLPSELNRIPASSDGHASLVSAAWWPPGMRLAFIPETRLHVSLLGDL